MRLPKVAFLLMVILFSGSAFSEAAYEIVPQLRASVYGSSEGIKCPLLIEPGQSFGPVHLGMTLKDLDNTGLHIKQLKNSDRQYLVGKFSVGINSRGIVDYVSAQLGDLPSSCDMIKKMGYIPNFSDQETLKKYFDNCGPVDIQIGNLTVTCKGISIGTGWSDEPSLSLTVR